MYASPSLQLDDNHDDDNTSSSSFPQEEQVSNKDNNDETVLWNYSNDIDSEIDHDGISSETREQLQNTDATSSTIPTTSFSDLGEMDPSEKLGMEKEVANVGNPQTKVQEKDVTVTSILLELAAIQQKGPMSYCIIGTRHCSYLHQQIIELL